VALRREEELLGVISMYRQEVRSFSNKEIALLQNFAAQAVIAMENARLITETREALEQQTATAEVLQVINSSPGDLAPVFDAILEKALKVCDASFGSVYARNDERFDRVTSRGLPPEYLAAVPSVAGPFSPGSLFERVIGGESLISIPDLAKPEVIRLTPRFEPLVRIAGARSFIAVALRKDEALLGTIHVYRQEVRPFSEREIALLQNFAAQAVIAMENARLLTETREALEQQTATAEVLQVINSSPGDLAPVFDAMLDKAMRLCDARFGHLATTADGEVFTVAAAQGPSAIVEFLRNRPPTRPGSGTSMERLARGERCVHVHDAMAEEAYRRGDPTRRAVVDLGGCRTFVSVGLRKDNALLGAITVYRSEVKPFSTTEIALIENFAAQAVIAIENTRLITETREALEQQTATAEILQVINSSPGNLAPVFDSLLERALRLCEAAFGLLIIWDGEQFHRVAFRGVPDELIEAMRQPLKPVPGGFADRLVRGERVIAVPDLLDAAERPIGPGGQLLVRFGARSYVAVALRRDDALLGGITIYRRDVRPFSEREIALLQNFAAQAVIAMDNARLLNEIRQRQAELRVTFDNMGDGVAMFDSDRRLAAWNRNFQELLDLPDTFLAERPSFAEYFHHLAERGEYGSADLEVELSRTVEDTSRDMRIERTRPDGRIIEVRRNSVPGGGFVLIYSDITERKRAEAEIHAARDTAERALQELQTAQASLLHAQKMAALGQLTAGIAHEIKNPLNFVNNFAELSGELLLELKETTAPAVAALGDDERATVDEVVEMLRGNLDKIAEHGKRADGIVKSMLEHSRGVSGERRMVDLNALIEEALNLAYHGARAQDASFNITLEREFEPDLAPTELAPQEMTRVFLNLFGNGFYATAKRRDGAAADFRPTLKVVTRDLGDTVEVRVRDNGTGIAPEIRDKLFQPFVTTKPTGEGTGLGLSIAYDIVTQQHGGTIEVDSQADKFTEFTIRLPRAR
jgi:PAS domain S-box-containing protein